MHTQHSDTAAIGRTTRVVLFVLAVVAGILVVTAPSSGAATYATYHVTDNVSARSTPTSAPTGVYGIPRGAAFAVQCQVIGQPVGPRGNTLYFLSIYAGRTFYIPDYYTDSPHLAGQPPIAGIPMCGGAATPPPATSVSNAVWVGSPVNGMWAYYASSLPASHHIIWGSDWSVDLPSGRGQDVILYAAPQDSRLSVTTRVDKVQATCASGRISDGGYMVEIGIYTGSTKIGRVNYAHIQPTVSVGQIIPRWGTRVGTIGSYTHNPYGCWDGEHVHVEMYSQSNYACFNKGYGLRQAVSRSNFIGFTGGRFASRTRAACP